MTAHRTELAQTWRLVKVTTASTEGAAPYTSEGDLYKGRWLDDSTERTKELSGLAVWTAHATAVGEWLLAAQTPLGHWEGVACYEWARPEYDSFGQYASPADYGTGATAAAQYAAAVTNLYGRSILIPDEAFESMIAASVSFLDGKCYLFRSGYRFDCTAFAGRTLRRVRVPYLRTYVQSPEITTVPNQIGIYTSDTTPATHGTWQTQDGSVSFVDAGRGCVQIKCDVELKNYLFITMIIDPAWSPTDDVLDPGGLRTEAAWVATYPSLGLLPVI
jgi:hypothetical protein